MATDVEGERFVEEDSDLSSWSSAFDPIPAPPQKSKKKKKVKKPKKKKSKSKKKPKTRARNIYESSDSAELLATGCSGDIEPSSACVAEPTCPGSQQATTSSPGRASPDIEDTGEYVFIGVWQPSAPQPRLHRTRACAKLLVRSGLRCSCHFRHVSFCPNRATSSPQPQLLHFLGGFFLQCEPRGPMHQAVRAKHEVILR